jgi:predicted  nucleic acid-binding Zn-ribbon protein
MDAAALIQAVTDMEERARAVPETVLQLSALAASYEAEVAAYLERVGQKKERVAALKGKIDAALDALQAKASDERPLMEGRVKEIESAVSQAREAVDEALDELEGALNATTTSVSKLQSALSDAGERAEDAQGTAGGDLDGLRGQMTSSEGGLDTFVATATNTTDGVEQAAEEARDKVVAGLDALSQRMEQYAEEHVEERLDRAASAVETMLGEHREHVDGVLEGLDTGAREIGQDVVNAIEEKVEGRLSALVENAAESYLTLQEAHDQAQQSTEQEREETGRTAAELFDWIAPMEQMVNQVRQAAANVNTPFPS